MEGYEAIARPYKTRLFQNLFDTLISTRNVDDHRPMKIVEVGMGTFPNAEYYTMKSASLLNLNIIGVDPNDYMSNYAQDSAHRAGLLSSSSSISLHNVHGVAESLPFDTGSVDAVVGTLTLCTVVNQTQTLLEIQRVLKPTTGRYLFWEHVLSDDDNFLALQQRLLSPLQSIVADGCHLDRKTGENIRMSGFSGGVEMEYMTMALGGGGSSIIGPTVFGIAST
jgi:ubiquinone/menaquinone biosynthesis C-methylase UbiE